MKKRGFLVVVVALVMLFSTISAFAASDPAVTIVNPAEKVYTDNLLISIKLTQPKTIRVKVNEVVQVKSDGTTAHITSALPKESKGVKEVSRMTPEKFSSNGGVSYYSKQVNGVKPGVYMIYAETLGTNDAITYSTSKMVWVKESKSKDADKILEEDQSNTMNFFQNILNALFGK